mmetsp:Transcript_4473/g.12914  ORF Transcript_4473/g.12914 Transcript_4473/m.12914 type:complete len:808 (+) Transcript_4473:400-2823(+)
MAYNMIRRLEIDYFSCMGHSKPQIAMKTRTVRIGPLPKRDGMNCSIRDPPANDTDTSTDTNTDTSTELLTKTKHPTTESLRANGAGNPNRPRIRWRPQPEPLPPPPPPPEKEQQQQSAAPSCAPRTTSSETERRISQLRRAGLSISSACSARSPPSSPRVVPLWKRPLRSFSSRVQREGPLPPPTALVPVDPVLGARPNYRGKRVSRKEYPDPTTCQWTFVGACEEQAVEAFEKDLGGGSIGVVQLEFEYTTGAFCVERRGDPSAFSEPRLVPTSANGNTNTNTNTNDDDDDDEKKDGDDSPVVSKISNKERCCPGQQMDAHETNKCFAAANHKTDTKTNKKELHIAPMLDYSKREFRKLFSILSTKLVLWTDMVVDETIAHSEHLDDILEPDRDLPNRQVCQIGGNSPELCGNATRVVELVYGYDEINLNIDCPSDRVSGEREFGAVLMKKIDVAALVLESMQRNVSSSSSSSSLLSKPVSIKCRIGVDDNDDFDFIATYIERLLPVCNRFYLHARKCVLNGLFSARQNRSIPPINYPRVYALCRRFPDVNFWINGGIRNLAQARSICYGSSAPEHCDIHHSEIPCRQCGVPHGSCIAPPYEMAPPNLHGCMMGRAAIDNPAIFWDTDRYFYGTERNPCSNRRQVLEQYASYLEELYPKRCCDDRDDETTHRIPVPEIEPLRPYCSICRDKYEYETMGTGTEMGTQRETKREPQPQSNEGEPTDPPSGGKRKKHKAKISNRLIGRSLKPIRGLFYGLPGGKVFFADSRSHGSRPNASELRPRIHAAAGPTGDARRIAGPRLCAHRR